MSAQAKLSDFNDLAKRSGSAAVAAVIADACRPDDVDLMADWPEPILPVGITVPDVPGTLLPSWVGDMASAVAAATQTPVVMSTLMALSVVATCVQRQFVVQPYADDPSYTESLAIWTLTAMPPGARKTAVIKAFTEPLQAWEKRQRDGLRSEIARVSAVRAIGKKQIEALIRKAATAEPEQCAEHQRTIQQIELDMPHDITAPILYTGDTTAETLQALLVLQGERIAYFGRW